VRLLSKDSVSKANPADIDPRIVANHASRVSWSISAGGVGLDGRLKRRQVWTMRVVVIVALLLAWSILFYWK
jgi:hypothetical protein